MLVAVTTSPVRPDGGEFESGGTLVGLTAADGVLLAADTRTSRGTVVSSDQVSKLVPVHPTAAMGSTADLGAARTFIRRLRAEVDRYELERGEPPSIAALGTAAVEELRSGSAPQSAFLLGGVDGGGAHVLRLSRDEGAVEDAYVAVGSGREIAYGVIDDAAGESFSMAEARRVAARAIEAAVERDVLTGGGIHFAEVTESDVDIQTFRSIDDLL